MLNVPNNFIVNVNSDPVYVMRQESKVQKSVSVREQSFSVFTTS